MFPYFERVSSGSASGHGAGHANANNRVLMRAPCSFNGGS
jgi:hypothetical protein